MTNMLDAHDTHCCLEHGCKYGDEDCPVATGVRKQQGLCEQCGLETEGYYGAAERTREEQEAYLNFLWEDMHFRPARQVEKVHCLVCDKELEYEPGPNHTGNVMDAGFMLVSFHYGSRHDQCHGYHGRKTMRGKDNPMHDLLACDEIEAFICDDCFEKKFNKMKGYDIRQERTRTKKFN
jgi:hypothetical protein